MGLIPGSVTIKDNPIQTPDLQVQTMAKDRIPDVTSTAPVFDAPKIDVPAAKPQEPQRDDRDARIAALEAENARLKKQEEQANAPGWFICTLVEHKTACTLPPLYVYGHSGVESAKRTFLDRMGIRYRIDKTTGLCDCTPYSDEKGSHYGTVDRIEISGPVPRPPASVFRSVHSSRYKPHELAALGYSDAEITEAAI